MPISIPAFLYYLLLVGSARAQVSAPTNCTDSSYNWSFNSLLQNPCWVAAYLAAVCNNGVFTIPDLLPHNSYTGPNGTDSGDLCKCNTVVYNLISACDACQGEPWIYYSEWSSNCTTTASPGTFPSPVPADTRVPKWAYIDTSIGNSWNISLAQLTGGSPEVTGTASIVPTSVSRSTLTPSTSPSSTSHHSSNSSAVVGGAIGGVIGAALVAGIVLWFALRRRRARSVPSATYMDSRGDEHNGLPKLYDPSDPTTYPSKEYLPARNQHSGSTGHSQPSDLGYSGLPEI